MFKLMWKTAFLLLFAIPVQAESSGAELPDLPWSQHQSFEPSELFCGSDTAMPSSYSDSLKWLNFIRGLFRGEGNIEADGCGSTAAVGLQKGVLGEGNDEIATANLINIVSGGLSGREVYEMSPESRFANDSVSFGYLYIGCKRFPQDELGCIREVLSHQSAPIIENSPIFCDFMPENNGNGGLTESYKNDADVLKELPASCAGILYPDVKSALDRQRDWWGRVDAFFNLTNHK